MFLDLVNRRNRSLIDVAIQLHQQGEILPDTYVLDLDVIIENAKKIAESAKQHEVELFYMTKQFGRNPLVSKAVESAGIKQSVVVDFKEALIMMENGLQIGHLGHLVQTPKHLLKKLLQYGVSYVTVFTVEKMAEINAVAQSLNIVQPIILKIIEPTDVIYEGQYGGFHLDELKTVIDAAKNMPHVHISGVTAFPCFLYDGELDLKRTTNVETLHKAQQQLKEEGLDVFLNMPSATCCHTIPFIAEIGGRQGEPGHALTGTTPLHVVKELAEKPAIVYVSEISHSLDGHSYFYGGGHYRRGHMMNLLISDGQNEVRDVLEPLDNTSIDYYFKTAQQHDVSQTVIASFRTQIFVTRADVAVVSGIQSGNPKVEGIYNSLGQKIDR